MPRRLPTRAWQRGCHAVIIGIHLQNATVEYLWIRKDGGMLYRGLVHYTRPGRTAVGEAITTFGLIRFRRFSVFQARQAADYAAQLELEIDNDRS